MARGKIIIDLDLAAVEQRVLAKFASDGMEIHPPIREADRNAARKALDYMKNYGVSGYGRKKYNQAAYQTAPVTMTNYLAQARNAQVLLDAYTSYARSIGVTVIDDAMVVETAEQADLLSAKWKELTK